MWNYQKMNAIKLIRPMLLGSTFWGTEERSPLFQAERSITSWRLWFSKTKKVTSFVEQGGKRRTSVLLSYFQFSLFKGSLNFNLSWPMTMQISHISVTISAFVVRSMRQTKDIKTAAHLFFSLFCRLYLFLLHWSNRYVKCRRCYVSAEMW